MTHMLIDAHCHLCGGLDDGPKCDDEALEMCEIAYRSGTSWIAATAHQSETWADITPRHIIDSVQTLSHRLRKQELPVCLRPTAEVMLCPNILAKWDAGELLSYSNQRRYLLVEFPHGAFFDIRKLVRDFQSRGVTLVIAHPERQGDLLYSLSSLIQLVREGCLMQVSSSSLDNFRSREERKALKKWAQAGAIHLIGSDAHDGVQRPPVIEGGYRRLVEWIGRNAADRICVTNGLALMQGLPIESISPTPPKPRRYFSWLFPN